MANIHLHYVENTVSRNKKAPLQKISFFVRLENLGFNKEVDVLWSDGDGDWHSLRASYYCPWRETQEIWFAEIRRSGSAKHDLPGTITFGLRYRVNGEEFWDNNSGWNYVSEADSGIKLGGNKLLSNISSGKRLSDTQKSIPITVAVNQSLTAEKVYIHWTKDNWRHTHKTPCFFKQDHWQKTAGSRAGNPNQDGVQIWTGRLNFGIHAFRIEYCIACVNDEHTLWDNNDGKNYVLNRKPLGILILNLHCYQEDNQDEKLSIIAKAIDEREADVVCLQEVAEHWNNGGGDWNSNSAKIINDRLRKPYHLYADWSHLGFDKYREGIAILSRFPLHEQASRYVSDSHDAYSIHSRKVVLAQLQLPFMGSINVFSAHLSWIEDGFKEQFDRLSEWAAIQHTETVNATLLCGDFNIAAGSEGYRYVVDSHQYEDQFLAASSPGVFEKIFKVNDPHWQHYLADDYRIDFIFMRKNSTLKVVSGTVLFTDGDYGRVSDHCGYLMTFEPE